MYRETRPGWDAEIRDEIIEECNKHGGVFHIYVDQLSPQGNVYVKCPTIASAASCVNALHGRWFAGQLNLLTSHLLILTLLARVNTAYINPMIFHV